MKRLGLRVILIASAGAVLSAAPADTRSTIAERVAKLTRGSSWKPVGSVRIGFPTHHPQGMVKIGTTLFVSSVEIKVPTKRLPPPSGGYDRDAGEGVGHLFELDMAGNLIADLRLGEGTIYHPGGIDYDGTISGCRWPSTGPTADRSSTASIPRR